MWPDGFSLEKTVLERKKKKSPTTTNPNQYIYVIASKGPNKDWDPIQFKKCTNTSCPWFKPV